MRSLMNGSEDNDIENSQRLDQISSSNVLFQTQPPQPKISQVVVQARAHQNLSTIDKFSLQNLKTEAFHMEVARQDFQKQLFQSVFGVKYCVNSIKEDLKSMKMKPRNAPQIKLEIEKKRQEIDKLIEQMKSGFDQIGRELQKEMGEVNIEMGCHRQELADILGFEDQVKGDN